MKQKILISGAGAIGGIMAAILAGKKYNIDLIVKYPELKDKAKTVGLKVTGHHGTFSQKVHAVLPSDLLNERYDLAMVATKANDMAEATKMIKPLLKKDAVVVSLQNGICEDEMASIVGREKTIGCVVGWGATMTNMGEYDMTSGGEFVIGKISSETSDELMKELQKILSHIVPVRISDNIYGNLYSKLIINSCTSTMGAISGLRLGQMLKRKIFRNIFTGIMKEAMAVAEGMNIKVEPYLGIINYYRFADSENIFGRFKRHAIIRIIGFRFRRLKSSSLQSIQRGKPTEIDYFNGYIMRNGQKFGVNVSLNEKLVKMVKEIEKGKRKITPKNFDDTFFDPYR